MNNTRLKCSVCGKNIYLGDTVDYLYKTTKPTGTKYQCCYTHYLKAKDKNKRIFSRTEFGMQPVKFDPQALKIKPNRELEAIYRVEQKYGIDCWNRTDAHFSNDDDVQFVRRLTNQAKQCPTWMLNEYLKDEIKDLHFKGLSIQNISNKVNVNSRQVKKVLRELKIERNRRGLYVS